MPEVPGPLGRRRPPGGAEGPRVRRWSSAKPWLARLLAGAGVVVLLVFACPRTRAWVPVALSLAWPDPSGTRVSGQPFRADHPGDALVVVSERALRHAAEGGDFSQTLWSHAWAGLLEQELGAPSVVDLEDLSPGRLSQARLIVFTRSATRREPDTEVLSSVGEALEDGAAVLLEMPSDAWSVLSGVVLSPEPVNPTGSFWSSRSSRGRSRRLRPALRCANCWGCPSSPGWLKACGCNLRCGPWVGSRGSPFCT